VRVRVRVIAAQVLLLTADQPTDRGGMSAASSSCALVLSVHTPEPHPEL
jgi:hypothetical protein